MSQFEIQKPVKGNTVNDLIQIASFSKTSVISLFGIIGTALLDKALSDYLHRGNEAIFENGITQYSAPPGYQSPNSDNEQINKSIYSLVNGSRIYEPDAISDGKGGYKPSSTAFWNGRLSSSTNQPVMTSLTFVGTTYVALSGKVITIPTITFEMVMVSIKGGRNIEKTDITGNDFGSVKEYISKKDYQIEIRAIIVASQNVTEGLIPYYQNGKYPEENMEQIDILLNAPIAIQVVCPYINKRCSGGQPTYLVIGDDYDINQVDGEYEIQRLTIPCLTDNPLVIKVANTTS